MKKSKGYVYIISAPSGGGKTTIVREVLKQVKNIKYSISCTTRSLRKGEKNSKDYFFISEDEFKQKIKKNYFAEYALVHGNYYGTPKHQINKIINSGIDVILDIDVQGAMKLKKIYKSEYYIFILPPSLKVLEQRLRKRKTDTEETIKRRLNNAKKELTYIKYYDYIVTNDKIKKAVENVKNIILTNRLRTERNLDKIEKFKKER